MTCVVSYSSSTTTWELREGWREEMLALVGAAATNGEHPYAKVRYVSSARIRVPLIPIALEHSVLVV